MRNSSSTVPAGTPASEKTGEGLVIGRPEQAFTPSQVGVTAKPPWARATWDHSTAQKNQRISLVLAIVLTPPSSRYVPVCFDRAVAARPRRAVGRAAAGSRRCRRD